MNGAGSRSVRFFFDFGDPESWLAAAQVEEVCARRSARLEWCPQLPAARPVPVPAEEDYRATDLRRYADHLGIPLASPVGVTVDARAACLLFHHAEAAAGRGGEWCHGVLERLWGEGRPLADETSLLDLAAGMGFERAACAGTLADPDAGGLLRAAAQEAARKAIFALPAFVTSEQLFIGHDRVFLLDEALEPSGQTTPFNRWFGARSLSRGNGAAEYELIVTPRLTNRRGVAHGGAVTSLLDSALGSAVVSAIERQEWCATLQLSVQFREPVRAGRVVCQGRMVKRGRHAAFAEGEVRDADGKVLAVATGTWYIWSRRPGS